MLHSKLKLSFIIVVVGARLVNNSNAKVWGLPFPLQAHTETFIDAQRSDCKIKSISVCSFVMGLSMACANNERKGTQQKQLKHCDQSY